MEQKQTDIINSEQTEPNIPATPDTETERESKPNSDVTEPPAPEQIDLAAEEQAHNNAGLPDTNAETVDLDAEENAHQNWTAQPKKRGPGRPWGSKTRPKHVRGVSEYLESAATDDERRHWERGTAIVTVDQLNTYISMAGGMSIEAMAKRINSVDEGRKNAKYANFVLAVAAIGRGADKNDVNDLRMRFYAYVELAAQTNNKLSNMNAYMSMGLTATKVSQLMQHGTQEQKDLLEEVKMICGGYRESLMSDGQLTPSTGMFWQKNFDGLRDQTEHIVTPGDPLGEMRSKREIAEKYADIIME